MKALIVVDVQNDFTPAGEQKPPGALPAKEGNAVVEVINRLMPRFDLVVATQDWHPPDHRSFASQHEGKNPGEVIDLEGLEQVLWPDHCVQETQGAEFVPGLDTEQLDHVVRKGTDRDIDSYSGFYDNGHRKATGLADYLKSQGVDEVVVAGLATDVCVKYTVLDALKLGFKATVVRDACRPVELTPGDEERAIDEMKAAGATVVTADELLG